MQVREVNGMATSVRGTRISLQGLTLHNDRERGRVGLEMTVMALEARS